MFEANEGHAGRPSNRHMVHRKDDHVAKSVDSSAGNRCFDSPQPEEFLSAAT